MFFFFFQAEDGIRDADVTGVQTCALPISCDIAVVFASVNTIINVPSRKAVMYNCQTVRCPSAKAIGMLARLNARPISHTSMTRLRSQRSTSTPAKRKKVWLAAHAG